MTYDDTRSHTKDLINAEAYAGSLRRDVIRYFASKVSNIDRIIDDLGIVLLDSG